MNREEFSLTISVQADNPDDGLFAFAMKFIDQFQPPFFHIIGNTSFAAQVKALYPDLLIMHRDPSYTDGDIAVNDPYKWFDVQRHNTPAGVIIGVGNEPYLVDDARLKRWVDFNIALLNYADAIGDPHPLGLGNFGTGQDAGIWESYADRLMDAIDESNRLRRATGRGLVHVCFHEYWYETPDYQGESIQGTPLNFDPTSKAPGADDNDWLARSNWLIGNLMRARQIWINRGHDIPPMAVTEFERDCGNNAEYKNCDANRGYRHPEHPTTARDAIEKAGWCFENVYRHCKELVGVAWFVASNRGRWSTFNVYEDEEVLPVWTAYKNSLEEGTMPLPDAPYKCEIYVMDSIGWLNVRSDHNTSTGGVLGRLYPGDNPHTGFCGESTINDSGYQWIRFKSDENEGIDGWIALTVVENNSPLALLSVIADDPVDPPDDPVDPPDDPVDPPDDPVDPPSDPIDYSTLAEAAMWTAKAHQKTQQAHEAAASAHESAYNAWLLISKVLVPEENDGSL